MRVLCDKTALPDLGALEAELAHEKNKKRCKGAFKNTLISLVSVMAVATLLAMLFLPVLEIEGTSMAPALRGGDTVVAVGRGSPDPGDIIAFYHGNNILVKRVIAGPGDWVDIDDDGNVYVNDAPLDEPYLDIRAKGNCDVKLPVQVPDGSYFVMGDARDTSIDSRNKAVGCVGEDMIIGRLFLRAWPLGRLGSIN